jgi:hypothetical protein
MVWCWNVFGKNKSFGPYLESHVRSSLKGKGKECMSLAWHLSSSGQDKI